MKKFVFTSLLVSLFFLVANTTQAQAYYVYDGDVFSVMLTSYDGGATVGNVQFSANGNWNDFAIDHVEDWEDSPEGGFVYYVRDGNGIEFYVDYYRYNDYIIVGNVSTGETWTLYRKP